MVTDGTYTGMRRVHGTTICNRCGSEVIPPQDPDDLPDHIDPDSDLWPTTDEYDPDEVDLVCGECDRTWPLDCAHDDIVFETTDQYQIEDGSIVVTGRCRDCNETVRVALEMVDIAVMD